MDCYRQRVPHQPNACRRRRPAGGLTWAAEPRAGRASRCRLPVPVDIPTSISFSSFASFLPYCLCVCSASSLSLFTRLSLFPRFSKYCLQLLSSFSWCSQFPLFFFLRLHLLQRTFLFCFSRPSRRFNSVLFSSWALLPRAPLPLGLFYPVLLLLLLLAVVLVVLLGLILSVVLFHLNVLAVLQLVFSILVRVVVCFGVPLFTSSFVSSFFLFSFHVSCALLSLPSF
jgi:hypothetical protein